MKNIIITLLSLSLLGTFGCQDFLEEDTRGIISPDNFYTSDEEAILAVNGLYKGFSGQGGFSGRSLYANWGNIQSFTLYGADEVGPNRQFGGVEPIQNYTLSPSNYGNARNIWQNLYRIIGDANSVINNVTDNPSLSPTIIGRVTGEALFLRSFAYYHLTNIWGAVPYYDEDLPLSEVAQLGRTDVSTVRQNVINDLNRVEAEELLPSSFNGSDVGRATVWATKMLKAKMMMWEEDWSGALTETTDIINNSPHRLLANYADVFNLNAPNPFHDEVIWGLDYSKDVDQNITSRTDAFNPRIRDEPANSEERGALSEALNVRNEEFNGFGLTVALPSFAEAFPMDDLRRPLNVLNEYLGFELQFTYLPKHWNLDFINSPRANHGELYIIFRLADTYLMAAEAANELGDPTAFQYINQVRERAYEPDQPYAGLGQEAFRQVLQDERKWELAAEGFRRYDLIRWGILVEIVQNATYLSFNGPDNILPIHVRAPIPEEEIILNPNLLEFDPTNNGYQ
ncbi:RagB/SusD family nutrient uptake outer membrane protein [Tunicatimonas pelagia]|uniref:RagB/SusD family nutrient uptake outer membrane protein n=1 Tax=Tunicatimonas pelagia TaxID=931531 RepID=UPI002666D573|nr:RagB/SusD family nutrient uptake outer membrane protein [Tunicatimonas pelagia]WKN44666.1 RagB/SusD family nutrient uptake outer membrane protein [Tunicatimonas pelagia]